MKKKRTFVKQQFNPVITGLSKRSPRYSIEKGFYCMTQKQINEECLVYMQAISDIGHNRELDMMMADYFGADIVDYTMDDLKTLKRGYELFDKADESIRSFENIVLERRNDKN